METRRTSDYPSPSASYATLNSSRYHLASSLFSLSTRPIPSHPIRVAHPSRIRNHSVFLGLLHPTARLPSYLALPLLESSHAYSYPLILLVPRLYHLSPPPPSSSFSLLLSPHPLAHILHPLNTQVSPVCTDLTNSPQIHSHIASTTSRGRQEGATSSHPTSQLLPYDSGSRQE